MAVDAKKDLRIRYRELRKGVVDGTEKAGELLKNCLQSVTLDKDIVVAGYVPLDGEVDVIPLMCHLRDLGHLVCVPVVERGSRLLKFREWEGEVNNLIPEVLFTPLVAFDVHMNRLGMGGGYYDYTMAFFRKNFRCRFIGAAYDIQLCSMVPTAQHDQKLDLVVTESRTYCSSNIGITEMRPNHT